MSPGPDARSATRPAAEPPLLDFIGSAYFVAGQYQNAAADAFFERTRLAPDTDLSRGLLIAALGHLVENDAARRIAEELKAIEPALEVF